MLSKNTYGKEPPSRVNSSKKLSSLSRIKLSYKKLKSIPRTIFSCYLNNHVWTAPSSIKKQYLSYHKRHWKMILTFVFSGVHAKNYTLFYFEFFWFFLAKPKTNMFFLRHVFLSSQDWKSEPSIVGLAFFVYSFVVSLFCEQFTVSCL